jgi:hypothetical protein
MTAFFRFSTSTKRAFLFLLAGALALFALATSPARGSLVRFDSDTPGANHDVPDLVGSCEVTLSVAAIFGNGLGGLADREALPDSGGAVFSEVPSETATFVDAVVRLAAPSRSTASRDLVDFHVDIGIAIVDRWSVTTTSTVDVSVAAGSLIRTHGSRAGDLDDSAAIGSPRPFGSATFVSYAGPPAK